MKKISHWILALLLMLSTASPTPTATASDHQATEAGAAALGTVPATDSISILPKSDVVAVVDLNRLLNDLLPKAKTAWPDQFAKIEKELNEFTNKATQAGIDLYKVKSLTIGLKLFGAKVSGAMIVDGLSVTSEFMADAMKDSTASIYKGKTLYIEKPKPEPRPAAKVPVKGKAVASSKRKPAARKAKPASAKVASAASSSHSLDNISNVASSMSANLLKENTAFVQLDAGRMAYGDEAEIKAVIDALTGNSDPAINVGSDLSAALQETNATGLFRFAVSVPESARQAASGEEFLKNLAVTRMVFGTLDVTDDLSLLLDAKLRTGSAEEATKLHESLAALLGLGKMMLGGNQDSMMQMLNKMLDQIKIGLQANDVSLALTVPRELYETFLKSEAKPAPAKSNK